MVLNIKLLSIVVPSYNSQDYLFRCLDTLVQGGPDLEIIVVDDGSSDRTAEIAMEYCARFPEVVRLERKENGGHGSAVNRGLEVATGTFFKVVDSDDWLEVPALLAVLNALRSNNTLDLLITNYVYEYFYTGKQNVVSYRNFIPQGEVISWDRIQRFRISQMLLMHSMIYRTGLLRECGLRLPEHTFYVDNIVAYLPLPFVKKMMYLDLDLYRYFIGRADQSVNTPVMIKRIDQQLRVTRILTEAYHVYEDIENKNLRNYMLHYLSMMVAISVVHINLSKDENLYRKADELWAFIRHHDERMYNTLRRSLVNLCVNLAGRSGHYITSRGFRLVQRIYKFS
jgi:glycosyltransferase involved in cell wall biosynthesis